MAACAGQIVALGCVFRLKMRRFYSKQWFIFSLLARDAVETSRARRDNRGGGGGGGRGSVFITALSQSKFSFFNSIIDKLTNQVLLHALAEGPLEGDKTQLMMLKSLICGPNSVEGSYYDTFKSLPC